jgi:hypothetical protein
MKLDTLKNDLTFWSRSKYLYYKEYAGAKVTQDYFRFQMHVAPDKAIKLDWVEIDTKGRVTLKPYFVYDGASGPTIDTLSSVRGVCAHDTIYRMIRLRYLPESFKQVADSLMYDFLIEDGMFQPRAFAWLQGVKLFGNASIKPENENPIYRAPVPFPEDEAKEYMRRFNPLVQRIA